MWFGLALIRFQVTLPVLLLFAVLRRWKVLAGAALGAASLLAVSLLLVGRTFVPTYWAALRFLGAHHDSATATNKPNVRGLVACVFGADPHAVLLTAVASAAVLLPAVILWSRRGRPFAIVFASAVMVAVAIDPHGFLYEWTLLLPSGVLLVECRPEWRWVLLGVGAMEVALLLARHGNLGWLGPVLAACGLAAARSERPVNDNAPVAAG